jgi:hypothetical protein
MGNDSLATATAVAGVVTRSQALYASAPALPSEPDMESSDDECRLIIYLGPSSREANSHGREDPI